MTIEELEDKHFNIDEGNVEIPISFVNSHTKLSIQFAIEILEELHSKNVSYFYFVDSKIQELKQYLDDKS